MKIQMMMLSIRYKLLVVFVLLITLTGGLIGVSTFINWERSAEQDAILLSQQVLYSKRNYMESYLDERIRSTLQIWFQKDVQAFIQSTNNPDPLLINQVAHVLENEMHLKQDLAAIFLYTEDGRIVYQSSENTLKYSMDASSLLPTTNSTRPIVLPPHHQNYFIKGQQVISIIRGITAGGQQTPHHYMLLDIHMDIFHKLVDAALWNKGYVFIVDGAGKFVYHPDSNNVGHSFPLHNEEKTEQSYFFDVYEGKKMLFTALKGDVSGWTYYGAVPEENLRSNIIKNRNLTLGMMSLLIIVATVAAFFTASRITRPLIELKQMMSKVEKGNFTVSLPIRSNDEIGFLTSSFNRMTTRLDEMTREVYLSRINETEAALKRLQAQINPHFLYNTLEAIHALATLEGIRPIQKIVRSLSTLFRYNISQEERLVTVDEEIKYLKVYLDIQQVRFQDKFQMHITIDPAAQSMQVLKFILQPLVENAFTHGLEPKAGTGDCWISVLDEGAGVRIRIYDNGVGMSSQQLDTVKTALSDSESVMGRYEGKSIGLVNVHQRLKLHYGDSYEMKVESKLNEGTLIEIVIPKENTMAT
ncbi:sensor histidine kinase [Paenibacillus sp. FSL H8-0034]|uniref:sensor histidine kinase n=1 Tax=Paenibacillus sp. FSL H8-0034 TaxID=2954671 RepID=UPI0030F52B4E